MQTNRVIRECQGYENNIIRVDLRDEDKLKYSWDSETDGGSFLKERVGGILKNVFELTGRQFEFLAYSSSSLR
jgi:RNA-dependent RNA polymerase